MDKILKPIFIFIFIFLILFVIAGCAKESKDDVTAITDIQTSSDEQSSNEISVTPSENATYGEINACKTAENYLRSMAFSEVELKNQLLYEGYSEEEANYALNHAEVDYSEECLEDARTYLWYMGFSEKSLGAQLCYDGYTTEQINYALDNIELDYNEQAVRVARSYMESMTLSKEEMSRQLEYEGFTESQIQYALTEVGY